MKSVWDIYIFSMKINILAIQLNIWICLKWFWGSWPKFAVVGRNELLMIRRLANNTNDNQWWAYQGSRAFVSYFLNVWPLDFSFSPFKETIWIFSHLLSWQGTRWIVVILFFPIHSWWTVEEKEKKNKSSNSDFALWLQLISKMKSCDGFALGVHHSTSGLPCFAYRLSKYKELFILFWLSHMLRCFQMGGSWLNLPLPPFLNHFIFSFLPVLCRESKSDGISIYFHNFCTTLISILSRA